MRPLYHVDVATTALPQSIAQPPGGIQTAGFPPHSKFASAWANWLFNYLGVWTREIDQSRVAAIDFLSPVIPQLLQGSGSGFELPEGSGLANLMPDDGGAYVLFGRRVSMTADELAEKYPTGFTLPPSSTIYGHAREETGFGGSSVADFIISTNISEPGYSHIWTGSTNTTDLVSQATVAETSLQWTKPTEFLTGLQILDPNNETALYVQGSGVVSPVVRAQSQAGGPCFQATPYSPGGVCFYSPIGSTAATGFLSVMSNSPTSARGVHVIANTGTQGSAILVDYDGVNDAVVVNATGDGRAATFDGSTSTGAGSVVHIEGSSTTIATLNVLGSGAAGAQSINAISSSVAGTGGMRATLGNNTGIGITGQTAAGGLAASRGMYARAFNQATGLEATASSGDAILASVTGTTGSAIHILGRAADSTSTNGGRIDYNTATNTITISDPAGAEQRDAWTSRGGSVIGSDSGGVLTNNNSALYTVACLLNLQGTNAPRRAGRKVLLRFSFSARSTNSTGVTFDVRVFDQTAGVVVLENAGAGNGGTAGYVLPATTWNGMTNVANVTTGWCFPVFIEVEYTIPVAGDRIFRAEFKTTNSANGVQIRNPILVPFGLI